MEVQRWAEQATHYVLAAGRLRAVARATGRVDVAVRAAALTAMANGYLAIGFEEVAAATEVGNVAAADRLALGDKQAGEGREG